MTSLGWVRAPQGYSVGELNSIDHLNVRVMGSSLGESSMYREVYRLLSYMLEAFDSEEVIKRRTKAD